jgi:hypothetical protein
MSRRRPRKLLTVLLAVAFLSVTLAVILSRVVASESARRYLTARLELAFGRPVEVSKFSIRWIPTPGIAAERVTISDDPRFGHEYFLRAQSIIASPRWRSLFLAKLELGTLELSHPSLNLVRNDDGRWNVESWLPPPANLHTAENNSSQKSLRATAKLSRIEIDSGRINFSRGADRRPLALEALSGSIEQESPGSWRIALAARPSRATVHLQQSGTLSVAGVIAGTSARLHPANLTLSLSDASLADAFRLALGSDPGIRGEFGLRVTARTDPESVPLEANSARAPARWKISLSARMSGLHRWDMPARADNPAANLAVQAEWDAGSTQIWLRNLSVEAPHSKIEGAGAVAWANGIDPNIHLTSSGISFEDIFAWYRSFQPDIGDGLTAEGFITSDVKVSGWPLRAHDGKLESDGATIRSAGITLAKSGPIETRFDTNTIEMLPMTWTIADSSGPQNVAPTTAGTPRAPAGTISFRARLFSPVAPIGKSPVKSPTQPIVKKIDSSTWNYELALRGDFTHFEDFLNAARLIGRPLNAGWQVEGGLTANLQWQGIVHQRFPKATGDVSPRAMTLKLPLLNQSVEIENARIELKPNEPRVTITKATALGAHWQGTIWRDNLLLSPNNSSASEWQFDLSADHLDAAELDRWIGPRARPNWLARIFASSGNGNVQIPGPGPLSQLRARGTLRADSFTLAPLELQSLRAQIEILGRNVNFSEFEGELNGGTISGGLLASLDADPTYWLHIAAMNVSVAELAMPNSDLRDRLAGQLSGEVKLSLHGIGREQLLNTLKGAGHVSATRFGIRGVSLSSPSTHDAAQSAYEEQFSVANAEISVDARKINLRKIELTTGSGLFDGKGSSDFSRVIQIDFWRPPQTAALARVDVHPANKFIRVSGTLEAPRVSFELFPTGATLPEPATVRH